MANGRGNDNKHFNCSEEHEFKYVSGLYEEQDEVYRFLKEKCVDGSIKYSTHQEIYDMIVENLGYPHPHSK